MPFTLTHIAAVVPVKKMTGAWLPFTALAIGSMVPDLPMFVGYDNWYSKTHSLNGVFTTCLAIGLFTYLVFQVFIRTPLLELMPNSFSARLGGRRRHDLKYLASIVVALTIGAATHVFWDSFTHANRWGVDLFPALKQNVVLFNRHYTIAKLLQHGSSVVFLPLLFFLVYRWARAPFEAPAIAFEHRLALPLWLKLTGCTAIFIAPAIWAIAEAWLRIHSLYYAIGPAARAYGRYLILMAIGISILIRIAIVLKRRNYLQRV